MTISTISFSALTNWQHCPTYFKLCYIDKIITQENTIWTHHGKLIHKYLQLVLKDEMSPKNAAEKFEKTWNRFVKMFEKQIFSQININPYSFSVSAKTAILNIKKEFAKKFGKYKVIDTEISLSSPVEGFSQIFRGFIDIVIELEDGQIVIIDFKNCNSSYIFNKFKDKYKDYQLSLYKHFYSKLFGVDPKKISTYFSTIERNEKSKQPVQFFLVTSGEKKIKNALGWLCGALKAINEGLWIKNRTACFKYSSSPYKNDKSCPFYDTKWCRR